MASSLGLQPDAFAVWAEVQRFPLVGNLLNVSTLCVVLSLLCCLSRRTYFYIQKASCPSDEHCRFSCSTPTAISSSSSSSSSSSLSPTAINCNSAHASSASVSALQFWLMSFYVCFHCEQVERSKD